MQWGAHWVAQLVGMPPLSHEALVSIHMQLVGLVGLSGMSPPLHACRCCHHAGRWGVSQRSVYSMHSCRHCMLLRRGLLCTERQKWA